MENNFRQIRNSGQSIWCDNISRHMIDSGGLQRLIDLGIVGVTSNPSIFQKAICGGSDYDARFNVLIESEPDTMPHTMPDAMALYEGLVLPDIADAADMLKPIYDSTGGIDGYISLEVSPRLAADTEGTVAEARRLHQALDRPNVFIKVPATPEGIPAIETLISDGISVNVTLIFSLAMHERVMDAYIKGIRTLIARGGDPAKVASVASFFVSRVDALVDKLLKEKQSTGANVDHLLGRAAVANARLAYANFERVFDETGSFGELATQGARVQRPLWASTSTKDPSYPDTKYCDSLIGPNTVNTLPPATIDAVLDHGATGVTLRDELDAARRIGGELEQLGINLDAVTDKLLADGVAAFAKSFDDLLNSLEEKRRRLPAVG